MLASRWRQIPRAVGPGAVAAAFVLVAAAPVIADEDICNDPTVNLTPRQIEELCEEDESGGDGSRGPRVCRHLGVQVDCHLHGEWVGHLPDPMLVWGENGEVIDVPGIGGANWGCWRQPRPEHEGQVLPPPEGKEADDGAWFMIWCLSDSTNEADALMYMWPVWWDLDSAPGLTAEEVAWILLAELELPVPAVRLNPPTTGSVLVRMPQWLATEDPAQTWAAIPNSDCIDGICVSISAQATRIEWDMGDGSEPFTCTQEQDVPWRPGLDFLAPESLNACHHRYYQASRDQPGGRFQVTATIVYETTWSSDTTGEDGVFEDVTDFCGPTGDQLCQTSIEILVQELQVLYGRP